ncbi:hypothetical protein NQZ68_011988 [Dissostichus eleginoides]|nr:hypothetical protein NQZ68_011988 [Dissostichus eleginoides]
MCVPVILLLLTYPDHLEKRSSKCPDIQLQRVCGEELKTETTERERGGNTPGSGGGGGGRRKINERDQLGGKDLTLQFAPIIPRWTKKNG